MAKLNEWLALRSTIALGTMWCAYAFVIMCILPLVFPKEQENILYLSNCFQLVFLPLLLVGQNIQGRTVEKRAQEDHAAIMEELSIIRSLHTEVHIALGIKESTCEVCASLGRG